jgi:hypothetical protein
MTAPATKPRRPPSLIERATQMAKDGYGWEDIAVKLDIPRLSAKYFVFGLPKKPEKSK